MKILVDTREQLPYWNQTKCTLDVGDYTTSKLLNKFHIERKSLTDLYGTLTKGNSRFKYELFRAAWGKTKIVLYIEGTLADFIAKKFPKGNERKFSSEGLGKLVVTFKRKYHVDFHWHTSRQNCKREVEKRLLAEERRFQR